MSGHRPPTIAGIDGCRRGWVVATSDGIRVVPTIGPILADVHAGSDDHIGIDMPIGLADDGARPCDREARALLGRRACTIFSPPPRLAATADTYAEALALSRAACGRGFSKQAWFLMPKVRELENAVDPALQAHVHEVHPELAFMCMTGAVLPPKRSPVGESARLEALGLARGDVDIPAGAELDDVLDAMAVLWSARRIARGEAIVLGGDVDATGRRMEIRA